MSNSLMCTQNPAQGSLIVEVQQQQKIIYICNIIYTIMVVYMILYILIKIL